jgi:adenine deaminase
MSEPRERQQVKRRELVRVALGQAPADLVMRGCRLVNVATCELHTASIAIRGDRIAAVGDVEHTIDRSTRVLDAERHYVAPGFVDAHLHCYHSYLRADAFAEALLVRGVTATVDGFYGQGIVGGTEAVLASRRAFEALPLRVVFLVPAMAYLQNRELGLTPAPGVGVDDLYAMMRWPGCRGLEEPPYLTIVDQHEEFLDLFEAALAERLVITGHAAGIAPRETQAYAAMGAATDHEMVEVEEALAKARAGMKLLIRQGTGATDVPEVIRVLTERGIDSHALAFCTDLVSPEQLLEHGGVDEAVRVAIANGVPPLRAIQMATLNAAELFGVQQDFGLIAPGRYADLVWYSDLARLRAERVFVGGRLVAENGRLAAPLAPPSFPAPLYDTVRVERLEPGDLVVHAPDAGARARVRVIGITDGSLESEERHVSLPVRDGVVTPSVADDVALIAMVDRLGKGTGSAVGFVQGFGLRCGAIASTVNSVCENLVAIGTDPVDMCVAMRAVVDARGGIAVAAHGSVAALVELPLLGLLSDDPLAVAQRKFARVIEALRSCGCPLESPLSQLEFCCACGEIGMLKLSEEGLYSMAERRCVDVVLAGADDAAHTVR